MNFAGSIEEEIRPLQHQLFEHPLYRKITTPEALNRFMEYHVFAVWDFMSLLKSLQTRLTCTRVPWLPVADTETAYLINGIVTGEETDIDNNGRRCSHFEWYLRAMEQSGSDTAPISAFTTALRSGKTIDEAFAEVHVPEGVQAFVSHTFSIIASGKPHVQAAAFTFGREDLIPPMFIKMVNTWTAPFRERFGLFIDYLNRHIEVDGDEHSHMAITMTERLCDTEEKRAEARVAVKAALQQRIRLWDQVCLAIGEPEFQG
ncbi:MAG: DUF3050 domain-containing protein [Mucilaginibacter polytrichastri]|nr:DUF3050 domain-containing protein [Mucilaginibacter polytrichastri]